MHESFDMLMLAFRNIADGFGVCRQAVNNTMQKFGLKTTKSKRARREAEAEEEAEATLQFKVSFVTLESLHFLGPEAGLPVWFSCCCLLHIMRKAQVHFSHVQQALVCMLYDFTV